MQKHAIWDILLSKISPRFKQFEEERGKDFVEWAKEEGRVPPKTTFLSAGIDPFRSEIKFVAKPKDLLSNPEIWAKTHKYIYHAPHVNYITAHEIGHGRTPDVLYQTYLKMNEPYLKGGFAEGAIEVNRGLFGRRPIGTGINMIKGFAQTPLRNAYEYPLALLKSEGIASLEGLKDVMDWAKARGHSRFYELSKAIPGLGYAYGTYMMNTVPRGLFRSGNIVASKALDKGYSALPEAVREEIQHRVSGFVEKEPEYWIAAQKKVKESVQSVGKKVKGKAQSLRSATNKLIGRVLKK